MIDVLQTNIDVGAICTPDRPRAARNTSPPEFDVNLVMLHSATSEDVGSGSPEFGAQSRHPNVRCSSNSGR